MRPETPAPVRPDPRPQPGRLRAIFLAIVVHAAFFALIVFGVSWQTKPSAPVEAQLWDELPPAPKAKPRAEPPKPKPEPAPPKAEPEPQPPKPEVKPEPPKPQPPKPEVKPEPPKPDPEIAERRERERLEKERAEQERLEREKQAREEEARRKRQQEEAEKKKRDEEARKKRQQEEAERKKREEAEKKKREEDARRKREEEQRRAEEERARQAVERARAEAASARQKAIDGYVERIKAKIRGTANIPDTVRGQPEIHVRIRILPGGEVLDIAITKRSGNASYDTAIERAIRSASPLPVPPANSELFPVFRDLNLQIQHER